MTWWGSPSIRISRLTMVGSAPKRVRHVAWLSTTTLGAPSSIFARRRTCGPRRAFTANTWK